MELTVYDKLNWAKDKDILKIINNETLYYCDKITKINHFNLSQERFFIITDSAIYNIEKKKLKRKICLEQILGLTFSTVSQEFVLHGNDIEYDYHFNSQDAKLILFLLAKLIEIKFKRTLKICSAPEKALKNYVTSKKEKKKDKTFSRMNEEYLIDTIAFVQDYPFSENESKEAKTSMGSVEIIPNDDAQNIKTKMLFSKHKSITNATLEDFKIIKILGRGNLGKVYLVKHKKTNEYFVMKSIKIEYLVNIKQIEELLSIQKTIYNLNYEFLIGVIMCFQTEERVYFIMPLIEGDNLHTYIRINKPLDETKVKFYAAIIGLTIDYLHNNGIGYRDIKLEDIIFDKDGYIKIGDFKLSNLFKLKDNVELMNVSFEHQPPEVIKSKSSNKDSDWWSYGIIIFQLLCGVPPYYSDNDSILKNLIIQNDLNFPKKFNLSKNAKELIKKLLQKNPNDRLGHQNGFNEIKNHPFFKDFDFQGLLSKKLSAPIKPNIGNILDKTEFSFEYTYEDLINSKILKK